MAHFETPFTNEDDTFIDDTLMQSFIEGGYYQGAFDTFLAPIYVPSKESQDDMPRPLSTLSLSPLDSISISTPSDTLDHHDGPIYTSLFGWDHLHNPVYEEPSSSAGPSLTGQSTSSNQTLVAPDIQSQGEAPISSDAVYVGAGADVYATTTGKRKRSLSPTVEFGLRPRRSAPGLDDDTPQGYYLPEDASDYVLDDDDDEGSVYHDAPPPRKKKNTGVNTTQATLSKPITRTGRTPIRAVPMKGSLSPQSKAAASASPATKRKGLGPSSSRKPPGPVTCTYRSPLHPEAQPCNSHSKTPYDMARHIREIHGSEELKLVASGELPVTIAKAYLSAVAYRIKNAKRETSGADDDDLRHQAKVASARLQEDVEFESEGLEQFVKEAEVRASTPATYPCQHCGYSFGVPRSRDRHESNRICRK